MAPHENYFEEAKEGIHHLKLQRRLFGCKAGHLHRPGRIAVDAHEDWVQLYCPPIMALGAEGCPVYHCTAHMTQHGMGTACRCTYVRVSHFYSGACRQTAWSLTQSKKEKPAKYQLRGACAHIIY